MDMVEPRTSPHRRAANAFERRVRERYGDAVEAVYLYGSVARGDERGRDSDVDLLVVISDDVNGLESAIRDLAYDVELDHGVVLSLIVRSASEFERQKERPFFRHVRGDAERLYG